VSYANFPSATSTVGVSPSGLLGTFGSKTYHLTGDFVQETFGRPYSTTEADVTVSIFDNSGKCSTAKDVKFDVRLNGASVGSFTWTSGTSASASRQTFSGLRFTFAAIAPASGSVTISYVALGAPCAGSWGWDAGTVTFK
jgi:hypothetical protein